MFPWLILTFVLLLVIAGLIVERAVSGYLNRKALRDLQASQERGFAQLGLIQKDLFVALKLSYRAAERAYDLAREEMKLTNGKLGTETKEEPADQWDDLIRDRDRE